MSKFLWWPSLLLLSALTLFGQANLGSITGTITDQSGAVIADANIEIINQDTGALFTGGPSDTGNFVVVMPGGTYQMTVTVPGFQTFVLQDIRVLPGQATRRDVVMQVGGQNESITVVDEAPLLNTESGEMNYRVESSRANNLPVLNLKGGSWYGATAMGNIRNPLAPLQMLPGVQFSSGNTLVVNGLPSNSQTITMEGQDATGTLWKVNQTDSQGSMDAIEEMAVQTSSFSAEYGKATGGVINYTMKSGTNDYHGSVYDYMVNEALNAGTPFTDASVVDPARAGQHIRNRQRRQDYGFTGGGPINIPGLYDGHDRTFFFFSFEQYRETKAFSGTYTTIPTAAYQSGNFSSANCFIPLPSGACAVNPTIKYVAGPDAGQQAVDPLGNPLTYGGIYDPASEQIVNGYRVRSPFPDNTIPLNRMDPIALKIQSQFPLPNIPNQLTNNYLIPTYNNYRHTTIPSIKIDHVISPTIKINGYWGYNAAYAPNNNGFAFKQFPWTSAQYRNTINHTVRLNYDQTLAPTLLLHLGIGYFHTLQPNTARKYDQTKLGLKGFYQTDIYPTIGGLNNFFTGGMGQGLGASFDAQAWEQKPTANANMTWIKGNHTIKWGGDLTLMGYPTHNHWRANGNFTFSGNQTANPWENSLALNYNSPTGFNYASFLLGAPNTLATTLSTQTRLGGHAIDGYIQDSWKVTPKLTIDYGLRYDFQNYLREQYGRYGIASFTTMNPKVGRPGALAYEATCGCRQSSNYPYGWGPRLSGAYQISDKTVFRAGAGVTYGVLQTPAGINFSVADFYTFNAPAYGQSPLPDGLQGGNPYRAGNPYGFQTLTWPNFDVGKYPTNSNGTLPPLSPFSFLHPGSRPGRTMNWSIGIQHEIVRNLVVEVSYVGNRGAWFYAPLLDTMTRNSLGGGRLQNVFGLDVVNNADLLRSPIGSPQAAAAGIGPAYVGMPSGQLVNQQLRPIPQWGQVNPYLGPPNGNTWYDSMQLQVTKRYSYGLDLTANFTWSKGLVNGLSNDTDFFLPGRPQVIDPFNRANNKQLNQLNPPLKTVISGTYTTPGFAAEGTSMKALSWLVRDWQIGAVLQYQSGQLMGAPPSNNQLRQLLLMSNAASFSGAYYNPWNYVQGQSFWAPGVDPNGNWDANKQTLLNPNAWTDLAPGQYGNITYLNNYRWRRRPNEAMSFGRNFRFGPEEAYNLQIRVEMQNVFNRTFYSMPSVGGGQNVNPNTAISVRQTAFGTPYFAGGFGTISTLNGGGASPRSGRIVARLTF